MCGSYVSVSPTGHVVRGVALLCVRFVPLPEQAMVVALLKLTTFWVFSKFSDLRKTASRFNNGCFSLRKNFLCGAAITNALRTGLCLSQPMTMSLSAVVISKEIIVYRRP